jgi:hypothetical protein
MEHVLINVPFSLPSSLTLNFHQVCNSLANFGWQMRAKNDRYIKSADDNESRSSMRSVLKRSFRWWYRLLGTLRSFVTRRATSFYGIYSPHSIQFSPSLGKLIPPFIPGISDNERYFSLCLRLSASLPHSLLQFSPHSRPFPSHSLLHISGAVIVRYYEASWKGYYVPITLSSQIFSEMLPRCATSIVSWNLLRVDERT